MSIKMVHAATGCKDSFPDGYSFTTLFFGPFPSLFRGHLSAALIYLILAFLLGALTAGFGSIAVWFIYPFIVNGQHTDWLMGRGWVPAEMYEAKKAEEKSMLDTQLATLRAIEALQQQTNQQKDGE